MSALIMSLSIVLYALILHASATTRFYDFKVQSMKITKMCKSKRIVSINQMFPGPVIYAQRRRPNHRFTNETPYNKYYITLDSCVWYFRHGVRQKLSCWSDGPSYITQCPIQSGQKFAYKFTLEKQKCTLFWHARVSWLRAAVYGAFVVYPKMGIPYPFRNPYKERIILLGEYWHKDVVQLEKEALESGGAPTLADAFTINGHPGPNYNCSSTSNNGKKYKY